LKRRNGRDAVKTARGLLLRDEVAEREAEISLLAARVSGRAKNSVATRIRDLRKFVVTSVGDFRAITWANDNVATTRMESVKHAKEILFTPGHGDQSCTPGTETCWVVAAI
jgi:hypothetical protein